MSDVWTIHTDGGARGNPGPAAFAFIIERPGQRAHIEKGFLGRTTNNVAEYTALVRALERARELGGRRLEINSDSELLVHQMNGVYKVKNAGIMPLHRAAKELCAKFDEVIIQHIRREENREADRLCNDALDETEERLAIAAPPGAAAKLEAKFPAAVEKIRRVRKQAVSVLEKASDQWANGDGDAPTPEDVYDQLWDLLRREGLLR
jgi:ribonuclease HI